MTLNQNFEAATEVSTKKNII